jgi:hypothetical protein
MMVNVIIAVVSALAGALVGTMAERWANNWGKIAVDLNSFEFENSTYSSYSEIPGFDEDDFDEFKFEFKTSVDIYNSKERFVTIKDLNIKLEINGKILEPKINKIITNNNEMETYSNSQFINVLKINPKEIKRIYFEYKIKLKTSEKIAFENNNYKIYFKYKEKDSKEKKVLLKENSS